MTRARELLLVACAATLITMAVTWPIAPHFGSAGRLDSSDGRFSVWNVVWVANALTSDPLDLWDANIFYPARQTLAYSEPNIFAGAVASPVWVLTKNPYAAGNAAIFAAFILAAVTMFALVRHLTGSRPAAVLAAILYAFSAYMLAHVPHIQLLMTFGLPLVLLRLHIFVEEPRPQTAVWLGAALALQALACGYYGIFAGLMTVLGLGWFSAWSGRWRDGRYWLLGLVAVATSVAIVAPFFAPYLGIRDAGFTRSLEEARLFRAGWRAYLASPQLVNRWLLPLLGTWREVLFPGFIVIGLAAATVVKLARPRARGELPTSARVVGFYLVLTFVAFWASFGPDAGLYTALYHLMPLMSMIRAPARLGVLVTLALVVVATIGFAAMERRWTGSRRRIMLAVVMVYALVRSSAGALAIVPAPVVAPAYQHLRDLPRAPVAEFPYFNGRDDAHRQTEYMLMSLQHWQPLLNGYSDFVSPAAARDMQALASFPSPDAWRVLHRRDARYIVFHWDWYDAADQDHVQEYVARSADYLRPLIEGDTALYEIIEWPPGLWPGTTGSGFSTAPVDSETQAKPVTNRTANMDGGRVLR